MKKTHIVSAFTAAAVLLLSATAFAGRTHEQILKDADKEVQKICLSMQPYMEKPDQLKKIVVEDVNEVNAYAQSDGSLHMFMGMINFAQSADELAMVCGHEEAHLSRQHAKRGLGSTILATVVNAAIGGTVGNVAGNLVMSKESRKFERESDRQGLVYAWSAGYDPFVSVQLWEGMGAAGKSIPLEKYLSDHPVDNERVNNFRILMYSNCTRKLFTNYCDEILADPELKAAYEASIK